MFNLTTRVSSLADARSFGAPICQAADPTGVRCLVVAYIGRRAR
jgi:hypothetical protein